MGAQPKLQVKKATPEDLIGRIQKYRAVEAVIWGMPAVNFELMRQAAVKAGAGDNEVVYWSKLLNWKNQTLTPNPNAIYLMPFMNTRRVRAACPLLRAGEGAVLENVGHARHGKSELRGGAHA